MQLDLDQMRDIEAENSKLKGVVKDMQQKHEDIVRVNAHQRREIARKEVQLHTVRAFVLNSNQASTGKVADGDLRASPAAVEATCHLIDGFIATQQGLSQLAPSRGDVQCVVEAESI